MKNGFEEWLQAEQYGKNTCTTQQSQVRRLEKAYGDLDEAFEQDKFARIYTELAYSSSDEAAGRPNPKNIAIAGDVKTGLAHLRGALRRYQQFLTTGATEDQWPELKAMRGVFVERCLDFEDFQQIEGTYFDTERSYKDALIAEAGSIIKSAALGQPEELGRSFVTLLQSKQANFVGWRTLSLISTAALEGQRTVLVALGEMLASDRNVAVVVAEAAKLIEPVLRAANGGGAVFGGVRSLVTCVIALARPSDAIDIKTRAMQRAANALLGHGIFKPATVSVEEYSKFLDLTRRVHNAMVGWGWKPRDLWDVQGFFWVTMDDKWGWNGNSAADVRVEADEDEETMPKIGKRPLNTILFGPPGTGKTWTTARLAVEICNGSAPTDRGALMQDYAKLMQTNRIQFTTFHQSIGYEEFVEGLRPETGGEDGETSAGFRLEARNGIFREICAQAEAAKKRGGRSCDYNFAGRDFYKMSLGKAWTEGHIYDAAMAGNYIVLGWGGDVDWSDPKYRDWQEVCNRWRQDEPKATGNSGNISQVWRFRTMKKGDIVIVSEGTLRFRAVGEVTGDYEFRPDNEGGNHRRAVKWLVKLDESLPIENIYNGRLAQASCYPLTANLVKLLALAEQFEPGMPTTDGAPEAFVLIIDEINRANVSKVLGELITLLESDKRLGELNELTVTLPYSGQRFGVPNNLYVIGTMNTADRSIAPLDTALRRRFSFTEMMPNYECIDRKVGDIHLGDLLKGINGRLEWLFDRDHQLGHSFFTGVTDKDSLDEVMQAKIVPLLGEYFYEDWSKVRVALNDDEGWFVQAETLPAPALLGGEARKRYSIRTGELPIEGYRAAAGLA